jgi:DNA-directed RNA polymerase specialized sigma24 family protein
MAANHTNKVIQQLRRAALLQDGAGLTDAQLLDVYISRREEAALTALVRRHGPMVWGVCRRILHNYHGAEDAFQAAFLVFVRKAALIACPELLANWLYGVAHQTALKARATIAKRRTRERQVTDRSFGIFSRSHAPAWERACGRSASRPARAASRLSRRRAAGRAFPRRSVGTRK